MHPSLNENTSKFWGKLGGTGNFLLSGVCLVKWKGGKLML